jgi:branched-chain amino acid transport system substrate-binding protein
MKRTLFTALLCSTILVIGLGTTYAAGEKISDGVVKVGVLTDMAGAYADMAGPGVVVAAQMAIEDFGGKVLGKPIELVSADHQNKVDLAVSKALEWYDNGKVDVIVDLTNSAVALAIQGIAEKKNRITLSSGPATTKLTNENCSPTGFHWSYDTYSQAYGTGNAIVKQGGDTWYFITVDYAFGHSLEKDTSEIVKAAGGKVLGAMRYPMPSSDFSAYLLKAQASGAKIIGMANSATDAVNVIKQASEFGITPKQTLAGLLIYITDIHSLGLQRAQGMLLTTGFYWDKDDQSRAWSKRFFERHKKMPTVTQAGVYSSLMHYFKAINAAGTDEAKAVAAKMREMPVNDMFAHNGKIRPDGRMIHDMYLMRVKKPSESKYPWDYYNLVRVIPAAEAFQPLSMSLCPLVKK